MIKRKRKGAPRSGNALPENKRNGRNRQQRLRWLGKSKNKNGPQERRNSKSDRGRRRYEWPRSAPGKLRKGLANNRSRRPESGSEWRKNKRLRGKPGKQLGELNSRDRKWPRNVSRQSESKRSRIPSARTGPRCGKRSRPGICLVMRHNPKVHRRHLYLCAPTHGSDGRR